MKPAVRIVSGDGHGLALAGSAEEGVCDVVVRSLRRPPVRATRVPVDQDTTLGDAPARALWLAATELADAARDLALYGADDGDLMDVVRARLEAVARAGGEVSL